MAEAPPVDINKPAPSESENGEDLAYILRADDFFPLFVNK